jgi:hypothetical protein
MCVCLQDKQEADLDERIASRKSVFAEKSSFSLPQKNILNWGRGVGFDSHGA